MEFKSCWHCKTEAQWSRYVNQLTKQNNKSELLQGQRHLNHFPLQLPLLGWLGFAAMALHCVFDGIHFMGSWALALSGWSTPTLRCSVSNLEFITPPGYLPTAGSVWGQFFHPEQPCAALPTHCGRDNTHVSAIPRGWDMMTVERAQWKSLLLWMNH